ncbi:hypothetical protein N7462_001942 [Penicillium macrosclerotiorum]|uniref:uncharacterized protein n=1 Tax=Penicillium macrosclerotiorum TaxID=303699 RepID=UPI00254961AF|nr:uncharacterized protein N7462_001942 [Penicillium macrosclerotiorum]KAJ5692519.1 hypothetical protein N7462_001942 [Penicillium macrosclerotiorum]
MTSYVLSTRWAPLSKYPVTKILHKSLQGKLPRRNATQSNIVDEQLCSNILDLLSPYLSRNAPVDVLDLWPNAGVFSSKVNNFLRPRRHVLIEPFLDLYKPCLEPLAKSKPCYELLSTDIYTMKDWDQIFKKHLPEQTIPRTQEAAVLPKNDSLLVLASPPCQSLKSDHFTPQRWWCAMMEDCMKQKNIHQYGSVRMIVTLPPDEVEAILPRSIGERRRAAVLTENVALHAMEVASLYQEEPSWVTIKPLDYTKFGMERVAEKVAEQSIAIPPYRERPPLEYAPECTYTGKRSIPHSPRLRTNRHQEVSSIIKEEEASRVGKQRASKALQDATKYLHKENQIAHVRDDIARKKIDIEETMGDLCYAAADVTKSAKELEELDQNIAQQEAAWQELFSQTHYRLYKSWDRIVDDYRMLNHLKKYDKSTLLYDQRPFEPLRVYIEEIYPRDPRSVIYFEPDSNAPALQRLQNLSPERVSKLQEFSEALTLVFGNRNRLTLDELFQQMFPTRSTNDLVKAIPGLAGIARKRLKPGSGPIALADTSSDPPLCFQDNIDYDLSETRIRSIPTPVIWDILLEYEKTATDFSIVQFTRQLGGTLTSFRAGYSVASDNSKRLR